MRSKGNACAIEQDINPMVSALMPLRVSTCGVMLMRVAGNASTHKAVTVRRDTVRKLILFHQQSNTPGYPHGVDETYLETLPENGMPADLKVLEVHSEEEMDAFHHSKYLGHSPELEKCHEDE